MLDAVEVLEDLLVEQGVVVGVGDVERCPLVREVLLRLGDGRVVLDVGGRAAPRLRLGLLQLPDPVLVLVVQLLKQQHLRNSQYRQYISVCYHKLV